MKTTLKRGYGRGAAFNGNGRAVLPPETVVASPPVTRYRQPPPPRRSVGGILARAFAWVLVAALTAGAGVAGGAYLYVHDAVEEVSAQTPEVRLAAEELDIALPGQPAIALVIGYDRRAGDEEAGIGTRSDTMMLLRADPLKNAVSMLSFPRDLVVEIRCPGEAPRVARINAAYEDCGTRGALETVRALTGLPVNYLVTVNFRGFTQVVANLGGVWIDVDRRYFNDNSAGATGYASIDLQPGYQKLNGQQALDFVRYRHTDSDLFRIARQQLFVKSFRAQVAANFSVTSLPSILRIVTSNVEVGQAGGPLSVRTLLSYGLFLHQLPNGRFFQSKVEELQEHDNFDLSAPPAAISAAVNEFVNPDVEAGEKATVTALGLKPKKPQAPPPAETTLVVLNGNGVPGAAADTSWQFRERGYVTLDPPNGLAADAPSHDYFRSKVYFAPDEEGAEAAARAIEPLVGEADVEPLPFDPHLRDRAGEAMVTVVIGQQFGGTLAPAPVDKTPQRQDPQVAERRDVTEPLAREAQKQVPFPVLVPTVLEETSTPAADTPLRVYEIAGRKTVRFTFATGASDYWGIQMVRWPQAPALKGPTRKVTLKGRTYDLHYVGPRLQMVVLRENRTTYWVVNTLRNALSNETMLEIAQGLKPLDG
ncbi:MAG TPA: LCP family protein [Gaiellaceae bacterium]|nr:LCP family protein [Gaiellaceae bacterium]